MNALANFLTFGVVMKASVIRTRAFKYGIAGGQPAFRQDLWPAVSVLRIFLTARVAPGWLTTKQRQDGC